MPDISQLIDFHRQYYENNEKKDNDRARAYYRGDFWEMEGQEDASLISGQHAHLAQKNLVNAICDTAVSSLLGTNPQVASNPQTPEGQDLAGMVNGLMSWAFRKVKLRDKAAMSLVDASLCKRGIFKVGWDKYNDCPTVTNPDPSTVFYDLTARHVDDIRYWIHACMVTPTAFKRLVESGRYQIREENGEAIAIKPEATPSWMRDPVKKADLQRFDAIDKRFLVYEFYDCEQRRVYHYHYGTKTVLFSGTYDYLPFSMYSLSHSGVDCSGLSEVQLILPQQVSINQLLTLLKRIAFLQVPKILYDEGRITATDLNKATDAILGSFVGVAVGESEELRNLASAFFSMPLPETPQAIVGMLDRLENDAAFQSALIEAARGRVAGAKTATEMAIIDAQQRTRLATREGHLNAALEDVASKMFYLMQRFMSEPKAVRISGHKDMQWLNIEDIEDLEMDFEMVSFNPIRKNPAVLLETLQALIPLLMQAPNIDVFKLFEELVQGLGLSTKIIIPEEQARQAQMALAQQQMQMQQQVALGGAAAPAEEPPKTQSEARARLQGEGALLPPGAQEAVKDIAMSTGQSPPQ